MNSPFVLSVSKHERHKISPFDWLKAAPSTSLS